MAARDRCVCQIVIPGDRHELGVFDADRGGEMNRVVAAQAVKLGELPSELCERVINANDAKLGVQIVDRTDCSMQRACFDSTHTAGKCRRGACLRVYELTRCYEASSVPELLG
jgi:hypothetical protein